MNNVKVTKQFVEYSKRLAEDILDLINVVVTVVQIAKEIEN